MRPLAALRGMATSAAPAERCDFCSAVVPADHPHVAERPSRRILCACAACALLFSSEESVRYRRIPGRVLYLADFQLTDVQWERLAVPISLAFFFYSTAAGRVLALYPSPGGVTECTFELASWDEIALANPVLQRMEADVEGLLVNRVGKARQYFLAPIDECYKLAGLIRMRWRGLSGGAEVWKEIDGSFAALKARARTHEAARA
jgi:hypothetical protein